MLGEMWRYYDYLINDDSTTRLIHVPARHGFIIKSSLWLRENITSRSLFFWLGILHTKSCDKCCSRAILSLLFFQNCFKFDIREVSRVGAVKKTCATNKFSYDRRFCSTTAAAEECKKWKKSLLLRDDLFLGNSKIVWEFHRSSPFVSIRMQLKSFPLAGPSNIHRLIFSLSLTMSRCSRCYRESFIAKRRVESSRLRCYRVDSVISAGVGRFELHNWSTFNYDHVRVDFKFLPFPSFCAESTICTAKKINTIRSATEPAIIENIVASTNISHFSYENIESSTMNAAYRS